MHELSITQSILSIALEKANEVQASRVIEINLIIGLNPAAKIFQVSCKTNKGLED